MAVNYILLECQKLVASNVKANAGRLQSACHGSARISELKAELMVRLELCKVGQS